MSFANRAALEYQDVLNMITSSPVLWGEITVSITAKSFVNGVTLTKHMEYQGMDIHPEMCPKLPKPTA